MASTLIYGRKPLLESLVQDVPIDRIYIYHNIKGEAVGEILSRAKEKQIPVSRVPEQKLNALTRGNHQGVVAFGSVVTYTPLQDIISHCFEQGENPFFILLDGITDVRNMGAIIRTAVCYGAHALIFSEKKNAPIYEDMIKTSSGAVTHMNFCREKSINVALEILKINGIKIYSSDLKAETELRDLEFDIPLCIVMGSEEKGISSTSKKASDVFFHIPMQGNFDSLNVGVATGIICYEIMQHRRKQVSHVS